jgi:hypothetical protein
LSPSIRSCSQTGLSPTRTDKRCPCHPFAIIANNAVTNARIASLHGLHAARMPRNDAPAASQTARSSRACIVDKPQLRRASVCGSTAGVALRLRSAKRFSPPSAPRSPLADHRPKPKLHLCPATTPVTAYSLDSPSKTPASRDAPLIITWM